MGCFFCEVWRACEAVDVAGGVGIIIGYLRLFLYPFEWLSMRLLILAAPRNRLCFVPHHWDEMIWFPLWGLDKLARETGQELLRQIETADESRPLKPVEQADHQALQRTVRLKVLT